MAPQGQRGIDDWSRTQVGAVTPQLGPLVGVGVAVRPDRLPADERQPVGAPGMALGHVNPHTGTVEQVGRAATAQVAGVAHQRVGHQRLQAGLQDQSLLVRAECSAHDGSIPRASGGRFRMPDAGGVPDRSSGPERERGVLQLSVWMRV